MLWSNWGKFSFSRHIFVLHLWQGCWVKLLQSYLDAKRSPQALFIFTQRGGVKQLSVSYCASTCVQCWLVVGFRVTQNQGPWESKKTPSQNKVSRYQERSIALLCQVVAFDTWRVWRASSNGGYGCCLGWSSECCIGPFFSSPFSLLQLCWLSSSGGSIFEAWPPVCADMCALGTREPVHHSLLVQSLMERDALESNYKTQLGQSDWIRGEECSERRLSQGDIKGFKY